MVEAKKRRQRGQSLIEMVFVIFISALLLSGLAAGTIFMLTVSGFARQRTTAIQLAKQELEDLQAVKSEEQWWASISPYCRQRDNCQTQTCQNHPRFSCQLCFDNCHLGGDKKSVEVTAKVSWGQRGKVKMTTVLSNWQ